MDFQKLRFILSLAKFKNVTRAARENYVAQSTMSSAISSAETELGFTLFSRSSRHIELTAAGKVFVERVERILNDYAQAISDARIAVESISSSLTIGFSTMSVGTRMPEILEECARYEYPESIRFRKASLDGLTNLLLEGAADIVFSNQFEARRDPSIHYVSIAEARPCVYVPRGHRIAVLEHATLSDLNGERLFCASSPTDPSSLSAAARILKAGGIPYTVESILADEETIALSVEAGLGLYPAATWYKDSLSERVVCVPLELNVESMYITAMWTNTAWENHARALAACAKKVFTSRPI